MGKFDPLITCAVCGSHLPGNLTRAELVAKGMSTRRGDGSYINHCPFPMHTQEDIIRMVHAIPRFTKANEIRYAEKKP